jgi:hypothetical protein
VRNLRIKHFPGLSIFTLIAMIPALNVGAQPDNSFALYGKPFALVFTNVNYSFNKAGNTMAFEITRAYLGYEYYFSKNISSKVNFDVADPGVGKLQMTAFIKNAFVQYKNNNFSARMGMISTDQFNLEEKYWGYRYIYKSFQDAYGLGPSADLGAALEYSPAKIISFDISVLNGEGYKRIQVDSTFKTTFGLTLKPFKGLVLRGYYDIMKNNFSQTSTSLFTGYFHKNFKAGIEYNIHKNNGMINGHDFSGISVYTSLGLAEKFSIFTRYDDLKSVIPDNEKDPWNNSKDGQLFMAGFDYSPVIGVKIAPTFLGWLPYDRTKSFTSIIALNIELRF